MVFRDHLRSKCFVGKSAAPTLSSGEGQIIIESTVAVVAVTEVGAAARGGADAAVIEAGDAPFLWPARET